MIEYAFAVAVGSLFAIQLCYYLVLYLRIYRRNKRTKRGKEQFVDEQPPLSVIVFARNQAHQLRRHLVPILEQEYPSFEVIVVNDGNEDESDIYLKQLSAQYPHLRYSFLPDSSRYISHKKLALMLGIKASRYEWLVLTNADCYPVTNQWLRLMARNFTPDTEIVLGYCGYERVGEWLNKRMVYQALFSAMRYLGFALGHQPYMGIGCNLAYRREMFFRRKGFSEYLHLQQGDDDLFVNGNATRRNTRVETDRDAVIRKAPVERAKEWREERISYMETSRFYKGAQRYLLGAETLTRLLFYAAEAGWIAVSILSADWWMLGAAVLLYLLRLLVQAMVVNLTAKTLGEARRYYLSLPLFDLLQPLQSFRWKVCRLLRNRRDFMRK
ncbi:MAG: glycosyltransferase [Prevotellaceae bacterium]|jgi:glycosyltransferase involved in cell wall biosynthesis|nr:glycosyltransferase [Prevotellaceae bacterium]